MRGAGPWRLATKELQDDPISGHLTPRGLVIRKDAADLEPDPPVPVERPSDVRGLEDRRHVTTGHSHEPTFAIGLCLVRSLGWLNYTEGQGRVTPVTLRRRTRPSGP